MITKVMRRRAENSSSWVGVCLYYLQQTLLDGPPEDVINPVAPLPQIRLPSWESINPAVFSAPGMTRQS